MSANARIRSVCSDAAGNIYTAGDFTNASGNCYIAKYDGTSWSELGGLNGLSANFPIHSVTVDAAGNVAMVLNSAGMYRGMRNSDGEEMVKIYHD